MATRNPRVSLTSKQLETAAGVELLALCQTVTSDGRLADEEVVEIIRWLKTHRNSDLPAVGHLVSTVDRIVADRRVTKAERRELYQAIERILPPEIRKEAKSARRDIEQLEHEVDQLLKGEERARQREERARTGEVYRANFMVAGVHYEGRDAVVREHVVEDARVYLVRDRANGFSPNAVEVRLANGLQIGFVPEDDAVDMAPFLDEGGPHNAYTTKILTGGWVPIPVVQAYVYGPDCGLPDVVFEKDVPAKRLAPFAQAGAGTIGCAMLVVVGLTLAGAIGAARVMTA